MSVNFELNIDNYTTLEIEKLIGLNKPYTSNDILKSSNKLRDQILLDGVINQDNKRDVISFIKQIVLKLNDYLMDEKHLHASDILETSSNIQILRKDEPNFPISSAEKINARDNTRIKNLYHPETLSKVISLDTTFRKNYHTTNSANVIWDLPTHIKNVVSMELVSLEIPNTYFQISKKNGNNHFYFKCTNSKITEYILDNSLPILTPQNTLEGNITIPDGNYTLNKMSDEINLQFEKLALSNPNIPIVPIEFTIEPKTHRCIFALSNIIRDKKFAITDNLLIRFDLPSQDSSTLDLNVPENKPIQLKIGWLLGFRFAQYTGNAKKIVGSNLSFNSQEFEIKTENFTDNLDNHSIKKHISYFTDPERNVAWLNAIYRYVINKPNLLFKNKNYTYDISLNGIFKVYREDSVKISIIGGAYTGFRDSEYDDSTLKLLGYDVNTNDIVLSLKYKLATDATTGYKIGDISLKDISNGIFTDSGEISSSTNGTNSYTEYTFKFDDGTNGVNEVHQGEDINFYLEVTGNNGGVEHVFAINSINFIYDISVPNRSIANTYVESENIIDVNGVAFVSEGVFDTFGNQYLYIVVDDYNYNNTENVLAIYNESLNNSYILARITKTGWSPDYGPDSWDVNSISNDMSSKTRKYFGPVDIQKLHIKIVDKYGRVVDLNEMDFSMALKLEYLYE
jgi:hypothetical protein